MGTVEEHSPPLHVERPPQGAAAGWFREEFLVQTRVVRGSREVHIHPHCRLTNMKGQPLLVRSGNAKAGEMAVVPHEGSVCLQREAKTSEQVFLQIASCTQDCTSGAATHWSAPIMLTKSLSGHRGFLRHMTSGGSGMTSVFEITMVDVKKDPVSDFLVVELRPYVQSKCPYFIENASRLCCSVSQLDGPEAGATLDLFPQESAPFVPVGAVLGGQGSFQVRLSAMGDDGDYEDQSAVIDIELPQETVLGPLHVQVLKERPRHIIIRDIGAVQTGLRRSRKSQLQAFPPFLLMRRLLGTGKAWIPDRKESKEKPVIPNPIPLSPRRRTRLNGYSSQFGSPASRKRTVHLGSRPSSPGRRKERHFTGASTPRLLAMPSVRSMRSLGSPISRLRKGTLDIFWTQSGRKRSYRSNGVVFQLCAEGAGITLVDSTALHEVAYFCVETLVINSTRDGAQHELDVKLGCVQVDVRDNGASWRSNVMLRPQRARLHNPVRTVKEKPFLLCSATWTALDRGAGQDLTPNDTHSVSLCFFCVFVRSSLALRFEPEVQLRTSRWKAFESHHGIQFEKQCPNATEPI